MAEKIGESELAAYAARYDEIWRQFEESVSVFGLPFARCEKSSFDERVARLVDRGVRADNDGKSLWLNWKSPACVACAKGVATETFLMSTKCPRNCFFCFNPNQAGYEFFLTHVNPISRQLRTCFEKGVRYRELAVTGGEPLLHLDELIAFLGTAHELYPDARVRLYTSAFGWTDEIRDRLASARLSEVRFSIKMEDDAATIEAVLACIGSAVGHFPAVMVEMPVMPNEREQMESLLGRLDEMNVSGINLLELCFPFHNADEFAARGFALKPSPYRVLYDYWYGGGLPVAGSEEACLNLMEYALDKELSLGVHYCSLENKLTGQVYRQNLSARNGFPGYEMDERDYFLKAAKAFGPAVVEVRAALEAENRADQMVVDDAYGFVQFPPSLLRTVGERLPNVAIGLSYAIVERDESGLILRELKLEAP